MPPCCQIPPGPHGNFHSSLLHDAQQFSRYVGGGLFQFVTLLTDFLTSSLHLEMKLWKPPPLARFYQINHAEHNSWVAMSRRTVADRNVYSHFNDAERNGVFNDFNSSFPRRRSRCALLDFDRPILTQIINLRNRGLLHAGLVQWQPPGKPPALGTVGLAQKLINIYVKYVFCWQFAGQFPSPRPYAPPFSPKDFLCALHAPIDRQVLKSVKGLPIGVHLSNRGAIRGENLIQSSNGNSRPWSKLDCLRTYYGFQLLLRRIALFTWPNGCGCSHLGSAIKECGDMFEDEFVDGQECQGPDWIEIANNLPIDVIQATIEAMRIKMG